MHEGVEAEPDREEDERRREHETAADPVDERARERPCDEGTAAFVAITSPATASEIPCTLWR